MYKFCILCGALAALFTAGCKDKDPTSYQQDQADNSNQQRWSYEGWAKGTYARDYNDDGVVDQTDFSVFVSQVSPDDTPPGEHDTPHFPKADVRGSLTQLESFEEDGYLGRVLIEGQLEAGLSLDKALVSISTETRIYVLKGDSLQSADFAALQQGQHVQAVFSGPVMKSDPAQADAAEVVVLK